ncbi:MAG: hypothetical protein JEZ10_06385 [Verrucomicrobia bacterium]|nr:hypothetical protein [Verrucomicrobiota bacterium]
MTRKDMEDALNSGKGPKVARFALAALGSIPFVGGAIAGAAGAWSEAEQDHFNKILRTWLKLQEDELKEIGQTITEVMMRVDTSDEKIRERIESPEYLSLIRKCFRDWSAAESEEKRTLLRNLLCNAAAGEKLCGDDIIRLFIEWVDRFTEGHFAIIRTVYKNQGITRHGMWQAINGDQVREDSAHADLFKLLIHDLSIGHVIRQHRDTDYHGNFLKARPQTGSGSSRYVKSAFDDDKEYELTELGRWFVHYTMNEMVPKLTDGKQKAEQ